MFKQVQLELDGDMVHEGFRITLEIRDESSPYPITLKGKLPKSPGLAKLVKIHWQDKYRKLGAPYRIKTKRVIHKGSFKRSWEECKLSAIELQFSFEEWLNSELFLSLKKRLQQELHPRDEVHLLIKSNDLIVQKLPWSTWTFFNDYLKAEAAFSPLEFEPIVTDLIDKTDRVRVLVILGHSRGIDVTKDMEIIRQLPCVKPKFLIEPSRTEISSELWNQPWEIIFFAGHSTSENDKGVIYINPDESITIDDLWLGLRQAVNRGLQLAIFNSCDGLGLAKRLNDLNIPQMIVMRELVADRVAQQFLTYFLASFSAGQSLYQAMRIAREQLDEMEEQFPCAGWLPVLCQNPTSVPPRWQDLYRLGDELEVPLITPEPATQNGASPSLQRTLRRLAITSLMVTLGVMGIRWLSFLETPELLAYDQLMRWRPAGEPTTDILMVEITPEITEKYGSRIEDQVLANLITKLEANSPVAIGLALHRAEPYGAGREALLDKFKSDNNLVTLCSTNPDTDNLHGAPPEFSNSQHREQVGFGDIIEDGENFQHTVRRQILSSNPVRSIQNTECVTPFSFSFHLAYRFLSHQNLQPILTTDRKGWIFGKIILRPLPSRFGGYQTLDGGVMEMLIDFRNVAQPAQSVTIDDILREDFRTELIRDRIILIGTNNPYIDAFTNTPRGKMASLWIHAHTISQLIDIGLGKRVQFWALPQWQDFLLVWFISLVGGSLALKFKSGRSLILTLAIALLLWQQVCLFVLVHGGWLPLIPVALGILTTSGLTHRHKLTHRSQ